MSRLAQSVQSSLNLFLSVSGQHQPEDHHAAHQDDHPFPGRLRSQHSPDPEGIRDRHRDDQQRVHGQAAPRRKFILSVIKLFHCFRIHIEYLLFHFYFFECVSLLL